MKPPLEDSGKIRARIRFISCILKFFCYFGMIAYPVLSLVYWIFDGFEIIYFGKQLGLQLSDFPYVPKEDFTLYQRTIGFSLDLFPCIFFILILFLFAQMFKEFGKGRFFSKANAHHLRQVGIIVLIGQLLYPFYIGIRNLLLNPNECQFIAIFGPNQLKILFLIVILYLAAYIMELGRFLEEDYKSTI